MEFSATNIISIILSISVPFIIFFSLLNRGFGPQRKGIGWQFIRFTAIATSIPIVGVLALNNSLTGEAATIISGALAFCFGKTEEKAIAE